MMAGTLILIVEDNEKNRKLIRDVLQVKGYQTLETETAEEGHNLAASANVATPARMAATRSPYAAGIVNAGESEGDTTPGIRKLSPTNRNVWGITNGMRASVRRMTRSRGQTYTFVTMAKAR